MTGRKPKALDIPDLPDEFTETKRHYFELCGSGKITYTEIKNYTELTGEVVDARLVMDCEYVYNAIHAGKTVNEVLAAFGYKD